MKNFFKKAFAVASIATCAVGLVACGNDDKTPEEETPQAQVYTAQDAYNKVYAQLGNMVQGFTLDDEERVYVQNYGLNFDLNFGITNGVGENAQTQQYSLKALIQTRYSENAEFLAYIGVKNEDEYLDLLKAYAFNRMTEVEITSEETFNTLKPYLYVITIGYPKKDANEAYEPGKFYKEELGFGVSATHVLVNDETAPEGVELFTKCVLYNKVDENAEYNEDTTYYTNELYAYLNAECKNLAKYELLETQPEDWELNYGSYYRLAEARVKIERTDSVPTFEEGKYFVKKEYGENGEGGYFALEQEPEDWDTAYYNYYEAMYGYCNIETYREFEANKYYELNGFDVRMVPMVGDLIYDGKVGIHASEESIMNLISGIINGGDTETQEITDGDSDNTSTGLISTIGAMTELIKTGISFDVFKAMMLDFGNDFTYSGIKDDNGNETLKMETKPVEGSNAYTKISITVDTAGKVKINFETLDEDIIENLETDLSSGVTVEQTKITITCEISATNTFDESYVPSYVEDNYELKEIGEVMDAIGSLINQPNPGDDDQNLDTIE